jgi:hypothetical protein
MEFKYSFLEKFVVSKETLDVCFYGLLLFVIPIILFNQFLVGTIVNALLIRTALKHEFRKVFFLAFLPSLAVLGTGFLFGGLTTQIIFISPFIWIGNLGIMFFLRKMIIQKEKGYFFSSIISVFGKTLVLFCGAIVLQLLGFVPEIFITIFGFNQLITGLSGAIIIGVLRRFL